jgi:hypothetical protein
MYLFVRKEVALSFAIQGQKKREEIKTKNRQVHFLLLSYIGAEISDQVIHK